MIIVYVTAKYGISKLEKGSPLTKFFFYLLIEKFLHQAENRWDNLDYINDKACSDTVQIQYLFFFFLLRIDYQIKLFLLCKEHESHWYTLMSFVNQSRNITEIYTLHVMRIERYSKCLAYPIIKSFIVW